MDLPAFENITPIWARIGEGAGGFLWFLAMVFLAVTAISLFRAGRHPAAKGLRLAGLALFFWTGATVFGAILREVAAHPALTSEIGYTANLVISTVLAFVGGGVDFLFFALLMFGVMKTSKRLRTLAPDPKQASSKANPALAAQPAIAAKPVAARPVAARPVAAKPVIAKPVIAKSPVSRVQGTTAAGPSPKPALVAPAVGPRAVPASAGRTVSPDIEAMIKEAGFAKPARVFTVRDASSAPPPSLASTEGPREDADTREVDMSSLTLPKLAEDDERESTLVQFPAYTPAGGAQA